MEENHSWYGWGRHFAREDLIKLAIVYRTAKKICRKCYKRLPANAEKCTNPKCHSIDLRFKKNCKICSNKHKYRIENDFYTKAKKLE